MTYVQQPAVSADRLAAAAGALTRYRIMAFTTGVVLLLGCLGGCVLAYHLFYRRVAAATLSAGAPDEAVNLRA